MAPTCYQVRIQGHLTADWCDWFEGLAIENHPDGTTTLSGPIRDQAALHGLLLRVWDLGLSLISVRPSGPEENEWQG